MSASPLLANPAALDFRLPESLVAREPVEARGLTRDAVRLMVSRTEEDSIDHSSFRNLPSFLTKGDVVVVNASATINAALDAWRVESGGRTDAWIGLHLSTPLPAGTDRQWVVELRKASAKGTTPLLTARVGDRFRLRAGATATLMEPYLPVAWSDPTDGRVRLWIAELDLPSDVLAYTRKYGSPIRYGYVREKWPLSYYQTMFATEPGSAEMPSAGRAFTREVVRRLEERGVRVARLVLHTGVGSLEAGELPYPERYSVLQETADVVNQARADNGRVVAVGTTVVRALETVATADGRVRAGSGWTDLVITPERGLHAVDALLTGLHEPRSSHLAMLEALAGQRHLQRAYRAALDNRYLWHEFGDLHLIMPGWNGVPSPR